MASTKEWFESVAEAQRRARRRLPKSVYDAILAGTERGLTLNDNVLAFDELGFSPHVADLPSKRDQSVTVLGQKLSFPVMISPTGVQAVHPDGEVAVARAAASAETAMGLSSFASKPLEDVIAANPMTFFQIYWLGDRDQIARRVERAHAAGATALMLTLDWSFATRRDRGSPTIPERLDLRTMTKLAPQVLSRPGWLASYLRARTLPELTVPNIGARQDAPLGFFDAYGQWMQTPPASWEDIKWLRGLWSGPFAVKGIGRADDARRAVDVGATAISVSNHGGNNLDGTPATIRSLPAIAAAVGDQIEVLLDGGIRRGSDVVKALALGARAVMIGRASLWGLAANGEAGVKNVLEILRSGIDEAMLALGRASVKDLRASDVLVPAEFSSARTGL
jgi:pre-mycofactocin synthase